MPLCSFCLNCSLISTSFFICCLEFGISQQFTNWTHLQTFMHTFEFIITTEKIAVTKIEMRFSFFLSLWIYIYVCCWVSNNIEIRSKIVSLNMPVALSKKIFQFKFRNSFFSQLAETSRSIEWCDACFGLSISILFFFYFY